MATEHISNQTIEEAQQEIIDEFAFLTDWMDKYEMIIQMGKELPAIDEKYKVPENLIKGCQSQVWLHADFKEGKLIFTADSDALITKGLVALVVSVLSGHTPKEIIASDLHFVDDIGLKSHLSPTRSNGLLSMLKQIKHYAIAFNTLQH
ncbi:cysteine desulfuration protein SufE [Arachidicoccus rhizosphaerae]|jgi:cysteine desulfuration protein SufE|uniref:Cysteine desulfuration protein SufE n=1 Tax=Arachidicoccus rhizosphaerae TaxID=551991 RepID=A0A1H3YLM6_9BACT|nr:SufE family protein [Arachidicoccus rhizosphaerae]SEA12297.1 cysteine desulfuration protein SufE [Arachidicoccus rhizosphaerae]